MVNASSLSLFALISAGAFVAFAGVPAANSAETHRFGTNRSFVAPTLIQIAPTIFNTASLTYLDGSAVHGTRNRRKDNVQTHTPHSALEIDFTFKGTAYSFNAGGYRLFLRLVKASQPPFSPVS